MQNPEPTSIFIGVDGGGTHTRAFALNASGEVLGSGTSSGSNPHNIGYPKAAHSILDAIGGTGVSLTQNTSICMGIAGIASDAQREELRHQLIEALPILEKAHLTLTHDLEIAHYAAFRGKPGVILIAGTGSACFAKDKAGKQYRASGRDFHYQDPGSGYAIGKRAIDSKLLLSTDSRQSIASLAPRVIELAAAGDLKALDVLRLESEHLAKLAKLVYHDFQKTEPFPALALSGSILTIESLYRYSVLFELQSALPGVKITDVTTSPAQAAAELAKSLA